MNAALALVEEKGQAALSVRAVARRAGVSAAAPYRHYADKEALLAAIATHGFVGLRAVLIDADRIRPGGEALVAQGVAYVRYGVDHPALFEIMFASSPARIYYPDPDAAGASAYAVLENRVAAQTTPENTATVAIGCWALVHGLTCLALGGQATQGSSAGTDQTSRDILRTMLVQVFDTGPAQEI